MWPNALPGWMVGEVGSDVPPSRSEVFERRAAMSRALRAFTRSFLLSRVAKMGSSLPLAPPCRGDLVCWMTKGGVSLRSLGGGEGRGMKAGRRGLSGTSGSFRVGAGSGKFGVFDLMCSITAELYICAVLAVPMTIGRDCDDARLSLSDLTGEAG